MLTTAWRKLYGHSPPCGAGVDTISNADVNFHLPMPVFRVVLCSAVYCFQTCIIVDYLAAHEPPLSDRKILFLEGR
ncbi:hypothetical protein TNCV_4148161 [Trichonephila clavipes]|nr:hypothetical protein TNCV_4148161 [Trichonephila clavipes]